MKVKTHVYVDVVISCITGVGAINRFSILLPIISDLFIMDTSGLKMRSELQSARTFSFFLVVGRLAK